MCERVYKSIFNTCQGYTIVYWHLFCGVNTHYWKFNILILEIYHSGYGIIFQDCYITLN